MKPLDDFIVVLGAAVAFLILLVAFFGGTWTGVTTTPFKSYPERAELTGFSVGYLGYRTTSLARTVNFGDFKLSEKNTEELKKVNELEISNGYIGKSEYLDSIEIPEEILENALGGKISFNVVNTNNYGDLIITWNGLKILERNLKSDAYTVTIPKGALKRENEIVVKCTSPGIKFWASDYYLLGNFEVSADYGPKKYLSFFIFSEELDAWTLGRLIFSIPDKDTGNKLIITVNGNEVYNKKPDPPYQIDFGFSEVNLRAGVNIVAFKTDSGYFDLKYPRLLIFLAQNKTNEVSKEFEIKEEYMDALKKSYYKGLVRFNVEAIEKSSPLFIKFLHDNVEKSIVPTNIRMGWNEVEFSAEDVVAGKNVIKLYTEGSYKISDVEVVLEKK